MAIVTTASYPTSYSSGTARTASIYRLYALLTSVGWVSAGEGNGTTGGMGTTGIVSSSACRWFVLKHPSSARQILMGMPASDLTKIVFGYSFYGNFAGGDSTNYPTADSTNAYSIETTTGIASTYFDYACAQDAEPYGWFFQFREAYVQRRHFAFIPVEAQTFSSGSFVKDDDPYVCSFGLGSNYNYSAYVNDYSTTTFGGGFCLEPGKKHSYIEIIATSVGPRTDGTRFWPYGAPNSEDDGYYQHQPVLWRNQYFNNHLLNDGYKGISTFAKAVGRQLSATSTYQPATFNNKTSVYAGFLVFPWDGVSDL